MLAVRKNAENRGNDAERDARNPAHEVAACESRHANHG